MLGGSQRYQACGVQEWVGARERGLGREGGGGARTLWHLAHGHDVAYRHFRLCAREDILSTVNALGGHKNRLVLLVLVGVPELDAHDGRAPPGVVRDLRDAPLEVPIALRVVKRTQLGRALLVRGVCVKARPQRAPSLPADAAPPVGCGLWVEG